MPTVNDPRFEVYPQVGSDTDHEITAHDAPEHLPGGEITVCNASCAACEWTAKGDPADVRGEGIAHERAHPKLTGEFGWRFRARNGKINGVGGEGFTRRPDAHRAIEDFVVDVIDATAGSSPPNAGAPLQVAIVNVDQDGRIVEDETPHEPEAGTEAEYADAGADGPDGTPA